MTQSSETLTALQQKSVERALRSKNPMEPLKNYEKYCTEDFECTLYCKTRSDMNPKILKWAFKLAETNVGPFYRTYSMGWQPKVKKSDLNKHWARYLVAVDKMKNPIAYAMFRFDMDYGSCVLYCYEMQIEKSSQRKGLGKFMMNVLENCAKHWQMEKIVLTVLKNNQDAMTFFNKLGYTIDDTSPDKSEKADYEILSKKLM